MLTATHLIIAVMTANFRCEDIGRDLIACQSFVSKSPRTHGFLHYEAMCYTRMCTLIFQFIILRVDSKQLNAFSHLCNLQKKIAKKNVKTPRSLFLIVIVR